MRRLARGRGPRTGIAPEGLAEARQLRRARRRGHLDLPHREKPLAGLPAKASRPADGTDHEDRDARKPVAGPALGTLPAAQREALALRESEGLTFRQIADLLKVPAATVKSRVRYALIKLADELKAFRPELAS